MNHLLQYRTPPKEYMEGLPVGCGRIAAMLHGTPKQERITLNHEMLWHAKQHMQSPIVDRTAILRECRELILAGKYQEAGECATKMSTPNCNGDAFVPAGTLCFEPESGDTVNYSRSLNLETAVARTDYSLNGKQFICRLTASFPESKILYSVCADAPFSGSFFMERCADETCSFRVSSSGSILRLDGELDEGLVSFTVKTEFITDGLIRAEQGKIFVSNVTHILAVTDIFTSNFSDSPYHVPFGGFTLASRSADDLFSHASEAYARYYDRVQLNVPDSESDRPTDERILRYKEGKSDSGLPALYFNYGRYLLITSSMECSVPANLQGMWNEMAAPPWDSDIHNDVNIQMNYWPAEACALEESTDAFVSFFERILPQARIAAEKIYGARGIVLPLNNDLWGDFRLSGLWGLWISGAPWVAQHFWWRWQYSRDTKFLKTHVYPLIKEISDFYESFVLYHDDGTVLLVPSCSPENSFAEAGPYPVSNCYDCAMDLEFMRDILSHCLEASELLGLDPERRPTWQKLLKACPLPKIDKETGRLYEWGELYTEKEPGHRHLSHLWGLYPGDLFTTDTPEHYQAAIGSLDYRLSHGGGHTGWSRAWTACLYARIGRSETAWHHIRALICDFATVSLLDLHPPRIFQIDGNLGGTAAVTECLLSVAQDCVTLLPALPEDWPEGSVSGLRIPGRIIAKEISWNNGKLTRAVFVSDIPSVLTLIGTGYHVTSSDESVCSVRTENGRTCISLPAGIEILVIPAN